MNWKGATAAKILPRQKMRLPLECLYLFAVALFTVALWYLPFGNYILYPFTILATWFHEMAHGLCAQLLGGDFARLEIFADGSGVAHYRLAADAGRIKQVLIAAAGPFGPVAGAFLILVSTRPLLSRLTLFAMGALIVLSVFFWVRSFFAIGILLLFGIATIVLASHKSFRFHTLGAQFLGVQACISVYQQVPYLYQQSVVIDGRVLLSDTGAIAAKLFLPHWFWATLIVLSSAYLLVWSLLHAYGQDIVD